MGDATNSAAGVTMGGDVAIDNLGVTTIQTGVVTTTEILDGTVGNADLAADAVATGNIVDGTIADADLNKASIPLSGFGHRQGNLGDHRIGLGLGLGHLPGHIGRGETQHG